MSEPWEEELLAALTELESAHPGQGSTTAEVAAKKGWTMSKADRYLRIKWLAGGIETCSKMQPTRAGNYHSVPAYRIKA